MSRKTVVATDKARIVTYCDPSIKQKLQQLADLRVRSLSNLVESLLIDAIASAEKTGELTNSDQSGNA